MTSTKRAAAVESPVASESSALPAATVEQPPTVEAVEAVERHPCAVCPMRSIAENSTFGYCEGCTRVTRHCWSCQQNKPQSGWGWGFVGYSGMVRWVCADCVPPPADPNVGETHPRFTASIDVPSERVAYGMSEALSAGAALVGPAGVSPARSVLVAIADCLRGGSGQVDVDVSDLDLKTRRGLEMVLYNARNDARDPAVAGPLSALLRAWDDFVTDSAPPPVVEAKPTTAEVSRRVHREVWT